MNNSQRHCDSVADTSKYCQTATPYVKVSLWKPEFDENSTLTVGMFGHWNDLSVGWSGYPVNQKY